jgi:hypothetical protein
MVFRIFCIVLSLFACIRLHAQEENIPSEEWKWTHTISRIDGGEYRGKILEWKDEMIVLEVSPGVNIDVPMQNVLRVTSRYSVGVVYKAPDLKEGRRPGRPYAFDEHGLYSVSTVHSSFQAKFGVGFTHAIGWKFSRMLSAGVGAGWETFHASSGVYYIPVFAEMRGFLFEKKVSPYYALRAGYGIAKENRDLGADAKGGWMASAEAGYRFGGRSGVNFFTGIGFRFQKTLIRDEGFDWFTQEDILYRRTELRFGIIF